MSPHVSIVIPSYNHAPFLRACLESVRVQTFEDWEVILVDDGSTDDSLEIARDFGERVRIFRNERNLGTYGTQQRGLEEARGESVAILNSDDLWHPEKLASQVHLLESHPEVPYCYTLGWMVDESGAERRGEDVHADWPTEPVQEVLPRLLR
jgi:glycosyltransferase involved in cell wall biosynthesis